MTSYDQPGSDGAVGDFAKRYDNFINGTWVPPRDGEYFENTSPVPGHPFCEVARSKAPDVELALDAGALPPEAQAPPAAGSGERLRLRWRRLGRR